MAGTFTIGEVKKRPGVYYRRENAGGVSFAGAINGIGAGIIRANWGPLNVAVNFEPSTDVKKIYGMGRTEDLITEMFTGGISSGKFVRIGTGGTAPTIDLEALTVTGAYVGDREFTLTIRDSLVGDNRECIIYDGLTEFIKVEFKTGEDESEGAALAAAINAATKDFIAEPIDGKEDPLPEVAQKPFTAGTNPTTTAEEYSVGLAVLEATIFNVLCVDTEDPGVQALVNAFLNRTYNAGSFPLACLAEKKDIEIETRMTHAAAFNDEKIVYCLNSGIDASGNIYDGYRLAARIGGMVAAIPSNQSLAHTVISGYAGIAEPLTNTEVIKALGHGCLVLTENSSGQVWIEDDINTLTTISADQDAGWKTIRRVKTRYELMQRIVDTIDQLVGKINNDTDGRAAVVAAAQGIVNRMVGEKKLLDSTQVYGDETNPPQGDSAWFIVAVDDIDSIKKVYLNFRFRFAPETT